MKQLMSIVEAFVLFQWLLIVVGTILAVVARNQEMFKLVNAMINGDFIITTCLVGIYAILEEKNKI